MERARIERTVKVSGRSFPHHSAGGRWFEEEIGETITRVSAAEEVGAAHMNVDAG